MNIEPGSGVCWHFHPHILCDGGADRKPEIRVTDWAHRQRRLRRPSGDDRHPGHRPHLRRPPQPRRHHLFRPFPPLPLGSRPRLHHGPNLCLHLRLLRPRGHLPPFPLRRSHRPRRRPRPGLPPRVYYFLQPHVRRHCRRHRHQRCGGVGGHCYAQYSHSRISLFSYICVNTHVLLSLGLGAEGQ